MLVLVLWVMVSLALTFGFILHGELRRLDGLWAGLGASVCAALAAAPLFSGSIWGVRVGVVLGLAAAALLLVALLLLYRDLALRGWLTAALYDRESGLPNRAQWERWRVQYPEPKWHAVRVSFHSLTSIRKLESEQAEQAFFNWFGHILIDRQKELPGFVARLSLRDIGFLLPAEMGDPKPVIERLINDLGTSLRSGGFEAHYQVRAMRSATDDPVTP